MVLRDLAKFLPLFWTVVLGATAVSHAGHQSVTLAVDLTDDKFVPDHLNFKLGVHYRLRLTNLGMLPAV